MARTHDIALIGATGATGRRLASELCRADKPGPRLLLVGRDLLRLRALADRLPGRPDIAVARASDPGALGDVASAVSLMVSTAGPFTEVGHAPVAASIDAGTDYLDVGAETPWIRALIDRHHHDARAAGVRVVPACGFDAVPSDLGCLLAVRALQRAGSEPRHVDVLFALRGGVPRGTMRTTRRVLADPAARIALADPRLLCPDGARGLIEDEEDPTRPRWHAPTRRWMAPFLLSRANTRIVRRSAALWGAAGEGYGHSLVYREGLRITTAPRAWATTLAQRALERALVADRWRARALEALAPQQLDGRRGFVSAAIWGQGADGTEVRGLISTHGDPTRDAAVHYAREAALGLLHDRDRLPAMAGVLTPATALGQVLVDRLRASGTTIDVGTV